LIYLLQIAVYTNVLHRNHRLQTIKIN